MILTTTLISLWGPTAKADVWPDGPWINEPSHRTALITAVAFVSAADLQLPRMMHIWHRLEKKYGPLNVDFIIVAKQEPLFPFSQEMVQAMVKEMAYTLPVFVDSGGDFSKLWKAYVSPTVNLVVKDSKVTSFDPGNFDPFVYERVLQKLLKENGVTNLPPKEYPNDIDLKDCHSKTLLVGSKFQKAWASASPTFDGTWNFDSFWVQKTSDQAAQMDLQVTKSNVGLIDESRRAQARVNVLLDGQKIPVELRGHDVQEDRLGTTFINVSLPKNYEILAHGGKAKETPSKLTFSTDTSGLKIWAIQLIPGCQDGIL